jgi:hypothetical protein
VEAHLALITAMSLVPMNKRGYGVVMAGTVTAFAGETEPWTRKTKQTNTSFI